MFWGTILGVILVSGGVFGLMFGTFGFIFGTVGLICGTFFGSWDHFDPQGRPEPNRQENIGSFAGPGLPKGDPKWSHFRNVHDFVGHFFRALFLVPFLINFGMIVGDF